MFNVGLGSMLLLCIVGVVCTVIVVTKKGKGMSTRGYDQWAGAFHCCIIGALIAATVASFVLILGG